MKALEELSEVGVVTTLVNEDLIRLPGIRPDAVIDVVADTAKGRFAVEERLRAPYPSEIARLSVIRDSLTRQGVPLLCVPFVSESLAQSLTESGWSWADDEGNFDLRSPGLRLRQRQTKTPPKTLSRLLPQGAGGLAIVRMLIRLQKSNLGIPTAVTLAAQARVSQPRVSQVLRQLQDSNLVTRSSNGYWLPDRDALLGQFLKEYLGPGGSDQYFYSLDSPSEVALSVTQRTSSDKFAISADVGPDLIAPWRRPSVVVFYANQGFRPDEFGFVKAQGRHDANIIVRAAKDRSVFPTPAFTAEVDGLSIPLVDPTQMIWDLQQLGGADRLEAADRLRQWLLNLQ